MNYVKAGQKDVKEGLTIGSQDCVWKPPSSGIWKLNCDAAQRGNDGATWGFCIRDCEGDVVAAGYKASCSWSGAEFEEAKGMYWSLLVAWESGYRSIIVESDCLSLVNKVKQRSVQATAIGLVVSDIIQIASCFNFCAFAYVRRDVNRLAHTIAKSNV